MSNVELREVIGDDLALFFEYQVDPEANRMAAFGAQDPTDRDAFTAKWSRILGDASITKKTILTDGDVAGSILAFLAPWSGQLEVAYWIGRRFWRRGVATLALARFLALVTARPLHARAAQDNVASLRVLEKCGFERIGTGKSFAPARGVEVDEVILVLRRAPEAVNPHDA
jgi:RimJ/RimL family protein N-acetyltransferase